MTTDCLRGAREAWRAVVCDDLEAQEHISDTVWEVPYLAKGVYMEAVMGLTDYLKHPINPFEQVKKRLHEERHILAPIATVFAEPVILKAASAVFGPEVETFYSANIAPIRELQFYYYACYKWWVD
ncbi:MAG: hypothetical protein HY512_04210 [Candidatus Aenigmarchaeota archaeon]|nr:hypothetical protein [Candidatus Aenigmarchaeota archaeon]